MNTRNCLKRKYSRKMHLANRRRDRPTPGVQRIQIRQPGSDGLREIQEAIPGSYLINGVEIAIDLIVEKRMHAEALQEFFAYHLVQGWRGRRPGRHFRGTTYTSQRTAARNIVYYADQRSRIIGSGFCCHIEMRLKGARAVRAAGITTIDDLIGFHHRRFWARELRLRAIDWERFARGVDGSKRRLTEWQDWGFRKRLMNIDLRKAGVMIHAVPGAEDGGPLSSAQRIVAHYGRRARRGVFVIENDAFLPNCDEHGVIFSARKRPVECA